MNNQELDISQLDLPDKINLCDLQPLYDALANAFGGVWYISSLRFNNWDQPISDEIMIIENTKEW